MKDHQIELTVPEIELCIDVTEPGQPYEDINVRPDDCLVQRAAAKLLDRHSDELEEQLCHEYVERMETAKAQRQIDQWEAARGSIVVHQNIVSTIRDKRGEQKTRLDCIATEGCKVGLETRVGPSV